MIPRVFLGMEVLIPVATVKGIPTETVVRVIDDVDYPREFFKVKGEGYGRSFDDLVPAPTLKNWMRGMSEWDRHYAMSDDPKIFEEGQENEKALCEMYKKLPQKDKYVVENIIAVFQGVTHPG